MLGYKAYKIPIGIVLLVFLSASFAQDIPYDIHKVLYNAQKLASNGSYSKAEETIKEFLSKKKKTHYLLEFYLGNILLSEGKEKEALLHFQTSVNLKPDFVDGWKNLAKTQFDLKKYKEAAFSFKKIYKLTGDEKYLYYSGVCYISINDYRTAFSILSELVNKGIFKKEWIEAYIYTGILLKKFNDVEKVIRAAISSQYFFPKLWRYLADIYLQEGAYEKALIALTIYSYMKPLKKEDLRLMGDLYNSIGIPREAAKYYIKLKIYDKAILSLMASHRFNSAIEVAKKALSEKPSPYIWFLLGKTYYLQGNYDKAIESFKKASSMGYEKGDVYMMMGYCFFSKGEVDKAVSAFRKALSFSETKKEAREILMQIEKNRRKL